MTESVPAPRRHITLYAILGGIIAATIPLYCTAMILIAIHRTPTVELTPSRTPAAIPSRLIPLPATSTPRVLPDTTITPTNTAFTPPTPTITPTPTETAQPTPLPTSTDTPPPTVTPTEILTLEISTH